MGKIPGIEEEESEEDDDEIEKKIFEKDKKDAERIEFKLNGKFGQHAPAEVVQAERDNLAEIKRRIEKLESYIAALN